jgi:tetratricopeptide (TPR) repeat protein
VVADDGPVERFCAGLRRLQQAAGLSPAELGRRLGYGRSQMYEILSGRIGRPPDWDRLVEPLVRTCTPGDPERAVADWRRRHHVLVQVYDALRQLPVPSRDGQPARAQAPVPGRLPAEPAAFVGRCTELAELDQLLVPRPARDGGIALTAIYGVAGVGKTSLAVRWASRVADRFPDGLLYVNLRGHDPERAMPPADAVAVFLRACGLTGREIPADLGARVTRYRAEVADRRMLILIDNAAVADQVRPLLPGAPGCATLVTSRDPLAGLAARDGARRLYLDVLPAADAVGLLRAILGARALADPAATEDLAAQCARLPLALCIAAEATTARATVPLPELVAELAGQRRRLTLLDPAAEARTAIRAVFSWAYQQLPPGAARAFRRLGLHPGPDIDPYAAAALLGTPLVTAERLLDVLTRARLLHRTDHSRAAAGGRPDETTTTGTWLSGGRTGGPGGRPDAAAASAGAAAVDIGRAAAAGVGGAGAAGVDVGRAGAAGGGVTGADVGRAGEPGGVAAAGVAAAGAPEAARVGAAGVGDRSGGRAGAGAGPGAPADGPVAARYGMHDLLRGYATDLANPQDTEAERRAALARLSDYYLAAATAAVDAVHPAEQHRRPRVPAPASPLPSLGTVGAGRAWLDAERGNLLAVAADAGLHGRPVGTVRLAAVLFRYLDSGGFHDDAVILHRLAQEAAERMGDLAAAAHALNNLGTAYWRQGGHRRAEEHYLQALALFRDLGDRYGQARTLGNLATVFSRQGGHRRAEEHYLQALALFRDLGDRYGEARTLGNLGTALWRHGGLRRAEEHYLQALALYRDLGDRHGEADSLTNLGAIYWRQHRYRHAEEYHQQALRLFRELGDRATEAEALTNLGLVYRRQGRYQQAEEHHQQAVSRYRELGDRAGEADALNGLAEAAQAAGRPALALARHHAALRVAAGTGNRYEQARAHVGLGRAHHATGDLDQARVHWQRALALFGELRVPDAEDVRAQLAALERATARPISTPHR